MLNESNIPLEEDGIEEEILVDEEVAITKAMWGDILGNIENQTDLQNALDAKQDSLTEAQLSAVNSGITAGKVETYDGYADQIASKADQSALNAESVARGEADMALGTRIDNEALARQQADNGLQTQIDAITSKSDVVDVVANYAALQAYDTSTLGNNDVVKVLDDETHEDALTYYRWSTTTQTWSYIGQEAPYYSKGQMDVKLAEKQDKLTAGANIQIQNGTISATDTTYTNGNGLNLNGTEFSADTDVLATKEDLEGYYTKPETDNLLAPKLEAEVVTELPTTGAEGKLYLTPKAHTTQTATGNPITATVAEEAGAIESFQLDGDTAQNSYTGKNLVGLTNNTISQGGLTATIDGDTITIDGTATGSVVSLCSANFNLTGMAEKKPAVSIFPISGSWTGGTVGFSLRDSSNTQVFFQQAVYDGRLFDANTLSESALASADHAFIFAGATTVFSNFKFKIMLSDSPVIETTYEPYVGGQPSPNPSYPQPIQTVTGTQTITINGTNYPLDLGDIQLCGLGDDGNGNPLYKDRIYRDGDDWKVHKETRSVALGENDGWAKREYGTNAYHALHPDISTAQSKICIASQYFRGVSYNDRQNNQSNIIFADSTAGMAVNTRGITIRNTPWSDLSSFLSWISGKEIECIYVLLESTDTTITDQTLISQLEAIRTASLENGTNTISNSATAPNLAGDMEVGYYSYNPRNRYDKFIWLDLNNNYEQIGS